MEIDKKIIKKLIETLEDLKKSLKGYEITSNEDPVEEVEISGSLISNVVTAIICGLGSNGYILAINAMQELVKKWK